MQGKLNIERMCQLAGVSRAGFYRSLQEQEPGEEMEVRSAIQKIFAEHKGRYGYRRASKELRRRGMPANHKRVSRLMREDNLLAVQPRAFVVTTDSDHDFEVYLNLASRMKLTGVNQLWVAARLPIAALEKALTERKPPPGVVHHSDRGVQYASGAYVGVLRRHRMIPSMSWPANPYDNASCESFIKTLKREEIYANEYRDLNHLRENIAAFIDTYYNRVRLHSALDYRPPEEFEQVANAATMSQGATMSFFRHEKIYRPTWDSFWRSLGATKAASPTHRLDEFPAGYSSAGWSPPEPASALPAEDDSGGNEVV